MTDNARIVREALEMLDKMWHSTRGSDGLRALSALETELSDLKADLERAREVERERIITLLEGIGFLNVRAALAPEQKGE